MEQNQKRKSTVLQLDLGGKIPPQAIDIEEVVIGAMLIEPSIIPTITSILSFECFYKENHRMICNAIYELFNEGNPVDILTVTQKLRKNGHLEQCGGAYAISQLTNRISSTANTEYHARIISEKHVLREIIRTSSEHIKNAYEDNTDALKLIADVENSISDVNKFVLGTEVASNFNEDVTQTVTKMISPKTTESSGITTGNLQLNNILGGWNAPDLILLAARPAMGKTALMIDFALKSEKKVAIFSLEMDRSQNIERMITNMSKINNQKIKNKQLSEEEHYYIKETGELLKKKSIYINDKICSTSYIRSVCGERKRKRGLDLVIIDYIQLIEPENYKDTTEQQVAKISRSLKKMAKDLNVPVIALSQLSRECETRADKRPMKSDLRHSGQLEQDADIILTLYRPSEYYELLQDPDYKNDDMTEGKYKRLAEIGIIKHRHGDTGVVQSYFFGEYSMFTDNYDIFETRQSYSDTSQNTEYKSNASVSSFKSKDNDEVPF